MRHNVSVALCTLLVLSPVLGGIDVALRGSFLELTTDQFTGLTTSFYCNSAYDGKPAATLFGAVNFKQLPSGLESCEAVSVRVRGTLSVAPQGCSIPSGQPVSFVVTSSDLLLLKIGDNLMVEPKAPKEASGDQPYSFMSIIDMPFSKDAYYNVYLEFVHLKSSPHPAVLSLQYKAAAGDSTMVDASCLSDTLLPGEKERADLQQRVSSAGWGTFYAKNMLSYVHMPEGIALHGGLCEKDKQPYETVIVSALLDTTQVRPGLHAYDQSYTEIESIHYNGKDLKVESALDDDGELVVAVTQAHDTLGSGDFYYYIRPDMMFGRVGHIDVASAAQYSPSKPVATASFPGLKYTVALYSTVAPTTDSLQVDGPHVAVSMGPDDPVIGFSVNKARTVEEIQAILKTRRAAVVKELSPYNDHDLDDAYKAIHGVLAWNTIFTPLEHGTITPVGRGWDAGAGYVLFEWDNYFSALMAGMTAGMTRAADIAKMNLIQMTKAITPDGCVPNFISGPNISSDRTEPPVGVATALELYKRNGELWVLQLLFNDFVAWNDWFWTNRREMPAGLITLGSDNVGPGSHNTFGDARYESGLDNSPMYEDGSIVFDTNTHRMKLYDVGMSSLYVRETKALLEMCKIVKADQSLVATLESRVQQISEGMQQHLYNADAGIFMNKKSDTNEFMARLSPTNFYPMIAGIATDEQAERMVKDFLTAPDKFCVNDECLYAVPSIARDDPAFADDDYWRGRTWGPQNYLVWAGLQNYSHLDSVHKAAQILSSQALRLLLGEWRLFGHVHENYNTEKGVGCNHGGSDPFYHWGALNGYIAIEQAKADRKV